MKKNGIDLSRLKSMSFFGEHVQEYGPFLVFDEFEIANQIGERMAFNRPEVTHPHCLEEHAAVERGLDRVFDIQQHAFHLLTHHRHALDQIPRLLLDPTVPRVRANDIEVFGKAPHARADRHLVVVQNHQQPLLQKTGVVERFEDDSRREGSVADDSDRAAIEVAADLVAAGETQCCRHA